MSRMLEALKQLEASQQLVAPEPAAIVNEQDECEVASGELLDASESAETVAEQSERKEPSPIEPVMTSSASDDESFEPTFTAWKEHGEPYDPNDSLSFEDFLDASDAKDQTREPLADSEPVVEEPVPEVTEPAPVDEAPVEVGPSEIVSKADDCVSPDEEIATDDSLTDNAPPTTAEVEERAADSIDQIDSMTEQVAAVDNVDDGASVLAEDESPAEETTSAAEDVESLGATIDYVPPTLTPAVETAEQNDAPLGDDVEEAGSVDDVTDDVVEDDPTAEAAADIETPESELGQPSSLLPENEKPIESTPDDTPLSEETETATDDDYSKPEDEVAADFVDEPAASTVAEFDIFAADEPVADPIAASEELEPSPLEEASGVSSDELSAADLDEQLAASLLEQSDPGEAELPREAPLSMDLAVTSEYPAMQPEPSPLGDDLWEAEPPAMDDEIEPVVDEALGSEPEVQAEEAAEVSEEPKEDSVIGEEALPSEEPQAQPEDQEAAEEQASETNEQDAVDEDTSAVDEQLSWDDLFPGAGLGDSPSDAGDVDELLNALKGNSDGAATVESDKEVSTTGLGESDGTMASPETDAQANSNSDSEKLAAFSTISPELASSELSPAEATALAELNDKDRIGQYMVLGSRVLDDLSGSASRSAAFVGAEHQPHVTDAILRTAMAMALSKGTQVLMIDASLDDKHLTSGLNQTAEPGLIEVLKKRAPWQQAVRATATPGLCVLPAGRLAAPKLSAGDEELGSLLNELTSQWEVVLLDAGSCQDSSAPALISAACNVYLVVRLGETELQGAGAAIDIIRATDAKIRGCVATNA